MNYSISEEELSYGQRAPPLTAPRTGNAVPSLYQGVEALSNHHLHSRSSQQQLAFTKEELELSPTSPWPDNHRRNVAAATLPHRKGRKMLRHGQMAASPSDLAIDKMNEVSGVASGGAVVNTLKGVRTMMKDNAQPSLRARPTVTTILRQQHVLEKVEKKEKDKVDSLLVSSSGVVDVDRTTRELDRKNEASVKEAEAKKLLHSKLAYERAIAASRKVADEKQKIAEDTRRETKEWQALLNEQREAERERRKATTEALQKSHEDSKRALEEVRLSKQVKATQVKQETEQLQVEAKLKKDEEERKRLDRIQQIQAAKLALKRTKEVSSNPKQFYRSIAVPETQIKLRLQKEEEERRLQETRKKIQAAKQLKSVKLIKAMKKIQNYEHYTQVQREVKDFTRAPVETVDGGGCPNGKCATASHFRPHSVVSAAPTPPPLQTGTPNHATTPIPTRRRGKSGGGEIDEMLQELHKLRTENLQKKQNQEHFRIKRSSQGPPTSATNLKVIGVPRRKDDDINSHRKTNNNHLNRDGIFSFNSKT